MLHSLQFAVDVLDPVVDGYVLVGTAQGLDLDSEVCHDGSAPLAEAGKGCFAVDLSPLRAHILHFVASRLFYKRDSRNLCDWGDFFSFTRGLTR